MGQPEETPKCPECGQKLWYDKEYKCWVCDECELEFHEEDEDWDEEDNSVKPTSR